MSKVVINGKEIICNKIEVLDGCIYADDQLVFGKTEKLFNEGCLNKGCVFNVKKVCKSKTATIKNCKGYEKTT